jgi:hypothetical protein
VPLFIELIPPTIVLWKRINGGSITLIDYRTLPAGDENSVTGGELSPWCTMLVKVDEEYIDGTSGARQNRITAHVQDEDEIPKGTVTWNYNHYNQVPWNTSGSEVVDSTLTSSSFDGCDPDDESCPDEIGVHAFYDSNAANDQFFADFSLAGPGFGSSGGHQY